MHGTGYRCCRHSYRQPTFRQRPAWQLPSASWDSSSCSSHCLCSMHAIGLSLWACPLSTSATSGNQGMAARGESSSVPTGVQADARPRTDAGRHGPSATLAARKLLPLIRCVACACYPCNVPLGVASVRRQCASLCNGVACLMQR